MRSTFWVFDLDGTLTRPVHDFDGIRRELGLPLGVPILEALDAMDPGAAAPLRRRLDAMELDLAAASTPQPGVHAVIEHLQQAGARLGIVTRNSYRNARVSLEAIGLSDAFAPDDCLGRDEAAPKPSPDGVLHLLRRWRASARWAVMVGDYLFDVQAGRAAGATTVLFGDGPATWDPFIDYRVHHMSELLHLMTSGRVDQPPRER